MFARKTVLM